MFSAFKRLNKFELCLWIFSLVSVIVSFLIPENKDFLTLIASLIGVTALIFVAKGEALGQVLCIVFAIFYGIISFFFKYYGELITYVGMSAPMALISLISWIRHPYKGTHEVEVSRVSKKSVSIMLILCTIVTIAFYFILDFFNTANIIFSTISITTSFLAVYLTYLRSPYYALGYMANDIVLIVLWVLASIESPSYIPMIICFIVFFINDLYGFINWRKMQKRQAH
ncbi:MAG: nicotinamide mononucleotide transporter [Clostridia bacterium]|nr:nicotinamide mononucleotide transporter [Clostridia bacterium]